MRDLVHQELVPHCGEAFSRCQIEGPDLWLRPKAAVALGMALHELATNAIKYGALSGPVGQVRVAWAVLNAPEGERLRLTWAERDGPRVERPRRKGFGSRLIERGLAYELHGDARIDYNPVGLTCTINAPLATDGDDPSPRFHRAR